MFDFASRDDKRYTEKKNKTERARRKKEDIARVRGLVDLALSLDPRIKQEEKVSHYQGMCLFVDRQYPKYHGRFFVIYAMQG